MVMTRNPRRIGRFSLHLDVLNLEERDDMVAAIMACCTIVRAEMDYASNSVQYVALSPQFAEVNEGDVAPRYRWWCDVDPILGQVTARVDRTYINKEPLPYWRNAGDESRS